MYKNFKKRFLYFKNNWKMIIHLLFSTYYFGVNNRWWSEFPSIFGVPFYKRTPRKIRQNYEGARFRAIHCYFIDESLSKILFPNYSKELIIAKRKRR